MLSGCSRCTRLAAVCSLALLFGVADLWLSRSQFTNAVSPQAPRLLVLVVFDQMCAKYLDQWQPLFEKDGFRRLEEDGAWFQNCHYPYAYTVTGAGHASFLTGCSPNRHGIVGNDWYERGQGFVNCVQADRHEQVPLATQSGKESKRRGRAGGVSPERMLAPTLGEVLKKATGGQSKVIGISFKDRSAALPAGRHADGCYWLEDDTGRFVTSTYYRGQLHPWVREYNQAQPRAADRWFGKDWQRFRPDLDYVNYSGPDDQEGEGKGVAQGRTFPHPLDGGQKKLGREYYSALYNSPFGNEVILDLAKRAIDAEGLGTGAAPDLLTISFSCNDAVGHTWGPDSQEVLDVTLRSDLIVRDLLTFLDQRVGRGNYVLALSADHGVCPLPEVSRGRNIEADRIQPDVLAGKAAAFLNQTFGPIVNESQWVETTAGPWLFLNRGLMKQQNVAEAKVQKALAEWLPTQPGIERAYTRTQLTEDGDALDEVGQMVRRSFVSDRCGDVYILQKPYYLFSSPFSPGTTHGTPHPYDTHVPLLVYGPGIAGGARAEPVTPQAIAAIFAYFLGIAPPAAAEAPVPKSLLR